MRRVRVPTVAECIVWGGGGGPRGGGRLFPRSSLLSASVLAAPEPRNWGVLLPVVTLQVRFGRGPGEVCVCHPDIWTVRMCVCVCVCVCVAVIV